MGRALELDCYDGFRACVPGVVAGGDAVDHARPDVLLRAVIVLEVQRPGDQVTDVVDLAAIGVNNRLDALRPAPAGLESVSTNLPTSDREQLDLRFVGSACLVRGTEIACFNASHESLLILVSLPAGTSDLS